MQPNPFAPEQSEYLLRVMEGAPQVCRRHQFFVWSQGDLQRWLPHTIALCGAYDRETRALSFDLFNSLPMPADIIVGLLDARSMLIQQALHAWQRGQQQAVRVSVPTPAIFSAPDLCRNTPAMVPAAWQPGMGHNDLEPVACRLHPEVAAHLNLLRPFAMPRMSGSGACVFAEFSSENSALAAQAALPAGVRGFVARGLDQHPLLDGLT